MTDYKQLCAEQKLGELGDEELWAIWNENDGPIPMILRAAIAADRARAALPEPASEGPTDEELWELYQGPGTFSPVEFARDVLARWGNHPGSPDRSMPQPAAGEVAESVELIRQSIASAWEPAALMLGNMTAAELSRVAELLEQLNPPQPVPVSKRLPGSGDCDMEGRCWTWAIGTWRLSRINRSFHTHWLPAHALPLPS